MNNESVRLGPPRLFLPISVKWPLGYYGGPIGYQEMPASDPNPKPIVLEWKNLHSQNKDPSVTPSILCDESGCKELAMWQVCYDSTEAYSCDAHVGDACNPDSENTVILLGKWQRP